MPAPTKPPCSGSWPEPPPETSPTLPATGASARMTSWFVEIHPDEPGVGRGDAGERLGHDRLGIVDELLHDCGMGAHGGAAPPDRGAEAAGMRSPARPRRGRGGSDTAATPPDLPKSVWLGGGFTIRISSLLRAVVRRIERSGQSSTMPNDFQDDRARRDSCQEGRIEPFELVLPAPGGTGAGVAAPSPDRRTRRACAAPCPRTSGTAGRARPSPASRRRRARAAGWRPSRGTACGRRPRTRAHAAAASAAASATGRGRLTVRCSIPVMPATVAIASSVVTHTPASR